MSGRVDGLVVMSPDVRAEVLEANLPSRLPAVVLGERVAGFAALRVDNEGGAAAMTEHLVGLGHRRIAHIAGAEGNRDAAERLAGYLTVMQASGLPTAGLVERGDFTEGSGYAAARRLIGGGVRPDVIFAANDSMAVGAMSALRDAGLRVPDDVGVAGFDDVPLSRHFTPALTSVHVPIDELGRLAVDGLHAVLEEGPGAAPGPELLATTLVVRASCGAAVLA
jgi:LacI family transcriptional regulator